MSQRIALGAAVALALTLSACGGTSVTRMDAGDVKDLSGKWNDTDSRLVAEEMIRDCTSRPWLDNAKSDLGGKPPTVIVGTVRNQSHEHIATDTFVEDLQRELINSGKVSFVASKNRMQLKKLAGITVLDDCYNANPSSMRSALTTLGGMRAAGRRVAVLGDMLELGPEGEKLHAEMGQYLVEMGVDELFTFGQLSRHINAGAREKGLPRQRAHHFSDFDLMAEELLRHLAPGDALLVKASRGMKLERVFEFLQAKAKAGALSKEERA